MLIPHHARLSKRVFVVPRSVLYVFVPSVLLLFLSLLSSTTCAVSHRHHRCIHDTETIRRLSPSYRGMDASVPQHYAVTNSELAHRDDDTAVRGLHVAKELAASSSGPQSLRVVVSLLDVYNTSRTCRKIGQVIPDFSGGTSKCTSADDILTDARIDLLVNRVIPRAVALHAERLLVAQPVASPLIVAAGVCEFYTIPDSHSTDGVPDADFVLYVSAAKVMDAGVIAWATYCQIDQHSRPVVGEINFNPAYLDAFPEELVSRVGAHELTHALGFSYDYWSNYKPSVISSPGTSARGKPVTLIRSSSVAAAVKIFFNCSTLLGAELEDEGGSGTALSHWERRNHYADMMAGVIGDEMLYSNLTLALFRDLGLYQPRFAAAEVPRYAQGLGCAFTNSKCLSNINPGFVPPPGRTPLFCNVTSGSSDPDQCTFGYFGVGYCYTQSYSSNLPVYFQYFPTNPKLGGAPDCVDYCPMVLSYSNRVCNDAMSDSSDATTGTYYGPGGRCMVSYGVGLMHASTMTASDATRTPMCTRVRCNSNRSQIQFQLGTSDWADCPPNGSAARVAAPYPYQGLIDCPLASEICTPGLMFENDGGDNSTTTTPSPSSTPAGSNVTASSPSAQPTTTVVPPPLPSTTTSPAPPTGIDSGVTVANFSLVLSGSEWGSALSMYADQLNVTIQHAFADALGVPFSDVIVRKVTIGSLVVRLWVLNPTALDTTDGGSYMLWALTQNTTWLVPLQALYRNASNNTNGSTSLRSISFSLTSTATTPSPVAPVPPEVIPSATNAAATSSGCSHGCVIGVAVGGFIGVLVVVGVVTLCKKRGISHKPPVDATVQAPKGASGHETELRPFSSIAAVTVVPTSGEM